RGMNATTDSSDSQWELVEEFVASYAQTRAINYVNLAAFVVILFDYLITLDCEPRCCLTSFLRVYLTRLLVGLISCMVVNYTLQTDVVILYIVWAAFSGLRIYALSEHNRYITWAVVLLALVPVGTNIYLETQIVDVYTEETGCMATIPLSTDAWIRSVYSPLSFSFLTRASLTASEAIVIVVTWMKTWTTARMPLLAGSRPSFTALVLREGMVYFGVVLTFNIMQIVFTFVESDTFSLVLQFLNVLTTILISRFYFDLDELRAQEVMVSLPSARSTALRFKTTSTIDETRSEESFEDHDVYVTTAKGLPLRNGYPSPVHDYESS
ncbi:hypothetical protein OH77DRAFT_1388275, partial [Trametes cingulata]